MTKNYTIPASEDQLEPMRYEIQNMFLQSGLDQSYSDVLQSIQLAVNELLVNIINNSPSQNISHIDVLMWVEQNEFSLIFNEQGMPSGIVVNEDSLSEQDNDTFGMDTVAYHPSTTGKRWMFTRKLN